jgi:hypothetical protein
MKNIFTSLFNFAPVKQDNNTTIINNAKIDTSVKRLEKDFHDGNIKQALDDLESLLIENKLNTEIKYQLYIKKTSFLFSLRRYDEALDLLKYTEKEYKSFLDTSFDELKLISFSMNNDNKTFFELVDKIKVENPKSPNIENFQLMYYLNTGNIDKAKEIFEKIEDELKHTKDMALMGGHIYSSLNDYSNADKLYQIALSLNISFLDKATIYGFYGTNIINNFLYKRDPIDKNKELLENYKNTINKILEEEEYFEKNYISNLKTIFLYTLSMLGEIDNFIGFFEKEKHDLYIWKNHYFRYINFKEIPIEHQKVQDIILKNKDEELKIIYLYMVGYDTEDTKNIVDFLDKNLDFIYTNEFVLLSYIKGKLYIKEEISEDTLSYIRENKYNNLEYIIAYIKVFFSEIKQVDIEKLLELAERENSVYAKVITVIHILKDVGQSKKYLNLAIRKQDSFHTLIEEVFYLIHNDKNLLLSDFEDFISQLDIDKYKGYIADIYDIYQKYDKSFELFFELWIIESNEDKKVDISFKLLELSRKFYSTFNGRFDKSNEEQIWKYLLSKYEEIKFEDNLHLSYYLLTVEQNIKEFLKLTNKTLLSINIQKLSQEIKLNLSALYFNLMTNFPKLDVENFEENQVYIKGGRYVINQDYYKNIDENNIEYYNFELQNSLGWKKSNIGNKYEKKSLFYYLLHFVYELDNPNVKKIEVNLENQDFSEIFNMMKELGKEERNLLKNYSNGDNIPFFKLARKEYRRYFALIPELLEDKEIIFDAGNPYAQNNPKILTLSSLVFLDYLGFLERVLSERNDVFIQKTLVDWLFSLVNELEAKDEEFSMGSDGENIFRYINTKDDLKKIVNKFIDLIKSIDESKIIDDTKSSLSIRDAITILGDSIGIQELQAIAFSYENDYQIISEDRIIKFTFENFKLNTTMVSNSISLLRQVLSEKEMLELESKLHQKKYKSLLHCLEEDKLIGILNYSRLQNILDERHLNMFHILYDYGCLDTIIQRYINAYKVFYPKTVLPIEGTFSRNMEYILDTIKTNSRENK